eukprot:TRINITY_DN8746_c0_g6_i1.p1 TRINITY_DN8746_c0_g6~~TRINITY_DN8746_c0_g6_i1.p1  ORF type:complete len:873 (-),score=248.18 TRINITY_DN8746_c0_g6_i1:71-2536(-)
MDVDMDLQDPGGAAVDEFADPEALRRAEEERQLELAAERAAAAEKERREREAEEERVDADPYASRVVKLTQNAEQMLLGQGEKWLKRVKHLAGAGVTVRVGRAPDGTSEARLESEKTAEAFAVKWATLCLRTLVATLQDGAVELKELPEAEEAFFSTLDLPADVDAEAVRMSKLLEEGEEIVVGVAHRKEDLIPKSIDTPIWATKLGLHAGQSIEGRYDDTWYRGELVGFSGQNSGVVVWNGGGECELPLVDIRASSEPLPPKRVHGGRLLFFGSQRSRMRTRLRAAEAVEGQRPGYFSEEHPLAAAGTEFGFGLKMTKLPVVNSDAVSSQVRRIEAASEAIVAVLSRRIAIAGEPDERERAESLATELVPQAGPFGDVAEIPEALKAWCSYLRVPSQSASHLSSNSRAVLGKIEDESGAMVFWQPPETDLTRARDGCVNVGGVFLEAGSSAEAKYGGAWHRVTILAQGSGPGEVSVAWNFDGSNDTVQEANVRLPNMQQRQRQTWFRAARVLAIVGSEQQRRCCVLRLMAACESCLPRLWSDAVEDALLELRDGQPEEEVLSGADALESPCNTSDMDWASGDKGSAALRRASAAAGCELAVLGSVLFAVGFPQERSRGLEYAQWVISTRREFSRTSTLSVGDADMREDVTIDYVLESKVGGLRPERLERIERETNTLALLDDGGGSAVEQGMKRLLVVGPDSSKREEAVSRIQDMLEEMAVHAPAPAPAPVVQAPAPVAQPVAAAPMQPLGQTNPKVVLATIGWPATINEWGALQSKIWKGHPRLPKGWIRVWSRSQDKEYYLRLKDMFSTFIYSEVPQD